MFSEPELVLSTLYRIYYGLPERSAQLKIKWKSIVDVLFGNIHGITRTLISTKQSRIAISSSREFIMFLEQHSGNDAVEILALLKVFHIIMEKEQEFVAANSIYNLYNDFISEKSDPQIAKSIDETCNKIQDLLTKSNKRRLLEIKSDFSLLFLDFTLRFIVLGIYRINALKIDDDFFIFIQILIIPLIIVILSDNKSGLNRKKSFNILNKYGDLNDIKIKIRRSASQYTLLALMVFSGTFITYTLPEDTDNQISLAIAAGIALSIYYIIYINYFSQGRLDEADFLRQKNSWKGEDEYYNPEKNDVAIVETESGLKAITGRLDAYVLESALLGALSFSGFLQIIAQNLISFEDLKNFGMNISHFLINSARFQFMENRVIATQLITSKGLFSLVAVETLLCSIFFLMVIAARLRFSNLIDRITLDLNIAKAYNEKEEMLFEKINEEKWMERLNQLNNKIGNSLVVANNELSNIIPINNYIQYFRNAGLMMFFIILISCSFFLSGIISLVFLTLALFTILYFTKTQIQFYIINWKEIITNLIINKKHLVYLLSIILILSGFASRMYLKYENSNAILAFGSILLCFCLILEIIFNPISAVPQKREPLVNKNLKSGRLEIIDWTLITSILLFFTGVLFVIYISLGMLLLCLVAFIILSISYIYLGVIYFENRIVGICIGVILGLNIFDNILSAFDASWKIFIYPAGLVIILYFLTFIRKLPPSLLYKSLTIFIIICNILWQTPVWFSVFRGYRYYTGSVSEINNIKNTIDKADEIVTSLYKGKKTCEYKSQTSQINIEVDHYILEYGDKISRSNKFNDNLARNLIAAADHASYSKDTCDLRTGLSLVQAANRINVLFKFNSDYTSDGGIVESDILNKLGRKDDAIAWLDKIKAMTSDVKFKKNIEKKTDEILSSGLKSQ